MLSLGSLTKVEIIRGREIPWVPASHEDAAQPGSLKKVLFSVDRLPPGRVQMVNLGRIEPGKAFRAHYHESMDELFIITSGVAEITVSGETSQLLEGDSFLVPAGAVHKMRSVEGVVDYVVFGIRTVEGGRTVVVEGESL